MGSSEDVAKEVDALDVDIAELRANYEQYFLGFERLPPRKKHEDVRREMKRLKGSFVRQTALKFRINNVAQKLSTYERLWEKSLTEIENGTYRRDLFKAKLHQKKKDERKKKGGDDDFQVEEQLDMSDLDGDLDSALHDAAALPTPPDLPDHAAPTQPPPAPLPPPAIAARPALSPPVPPVAPSAPRSPSVAPAFSPPQVKPPVTGAPPPPPRGTGEQLAFAPPAAKGPAAPGIKPLTAPVAAVPRPSAPPQITPAGASPPTVRPPLITPAGAPAVAKPTAGLAGGRPSSVSSAGFPAVPPRAPLAKPPQAAAAPVAAAAGGLSDQKVKAIYDAYMTAKRRCGEETAGMSLDSVASTLRKQVPELMKQHNARNIEFKVVIKDGKAVLRALPKDE